MFLAFPIVRTSQFQHAFPVPILIAKGNLSRKPGAMRGYTRPFTAVSMTYGTGVNTVCVCVCVCVHISIHTDIRAQDAANQL